jgi:hypothetical protein
MAIKTIAKAHHPTTKTPRLNIQLSNHERVCGKTN